MVGGSDGRGTPLEQAQAALAELRAAAQQLERQHRELQTLVRQIEAEIPPLSTRKGERDETLRAIEANPSSYPPANIREAYEAHAEASMRLYMMQSQADALRQREQMLAAHLASTQNHAVALEQVVATLPQRSGAAGAWGGDAASLGDIPGLEAARRIVAAREAHSEWLARRLQEGPLQTLSNLVLQAEVSQRLLSRSPERARDEMQTLKANLARGLADTRYFAGELHPPALQDLGLRSTVRRYATEMAARGGREVRVELGGQDVPLPAETEVALYRIAQDSLKWAMASTRAPKFDLALSTESDLIRLSLQVADYAGDREADQEIADRLRTYALAIGGDLKVDTEPRGLRINLVLNPAPA